jgi:hypothetical protein
MALKKFLRYSLVIIFLILGLYFIISGKSIFHLLPLPEHQIDQCHIPGSNEIIRIYQGNLGETVDYWYVVTYQQNFIASEKTIVETYSGPDFKKVNCLTNSIILIPQYWGGKPYIVQNELIRASLTKKPIGFDGGNPTDIAPTLFFSRVIKLLLGTCVTVIGVVQIIKINSTEKILRTSTIKS